LANLTNRSRVGGSFVFGVIFYVLRGWSRTAETARAVAEFDPPMRCWGCCGVINNMPPPSVGFRLCQPSRAEAIHCLCSHSDVVEQKAARCNPKGTSALDI
jgi:hypothetical protein